MNLQDGDDNDIGASPNLQDLAHQSCLECKLRKNFSSFAWEHVLPEAKLRIIPSPQLDMKFSQWNFLLLTMRFINGTVSFKLGKNMIETNQRHTWTSKTLNSGHQVVANILQKEKKTNNWRAWSVASVFSTRPHVFSRFPSGRSIIDIKQHDLLNNILKGPPFLRKISKLKSNEWFFETSAIYDRANRNEFRIFFLTVHT